MSWYEHRLNETFTFRHVSWPDWLELEDYWQVTGGSLEFSAFTDLKASGTLQFEGTDLPADHDMVRIYYSFDDVRGQRHTEPMATLFVECSEPTRDGVTVHGTAECYSVLKVLSDRRYGMPFTVPAGTRAVFKAVELAESVGLRIGSPDPSDYEIMSDHTFDEDASYLEIVNWLLSAAGFSSVAPDAYGTLQMRRYAEPTERPAVMTFRDDELSIMYPEVALKRDWISTPNTCRLYYESEEESLWACTQNIDPTFEASLTSRGREITLFETVSELTGDTQEARLANLMEKSRQKLIDNSSEIEYVTLKCAWIPLSPNDSIRVEYAAAGIEWAGSVTNVSVDLDVSVPCKIEARRFVKSGMKTKTDGGVL